MQKIHIATSREIGIKCREWAFDNLPDNCELVEDPNDSDIFISVLYDKLLSPFFINNRKCFNFHPGILPQYRGAGAYSWVLINDDDKTGITLHLIDDGIDSGDIIEIRAFPVDRHRDTAYTLYNRGEKTMFKMFKDWFENIISENYEAIKQDESCAAIYYRKDLNAIKDLSRYIRALTFEGKESAYYTDNLGQKKYIYFEDKD